MNNLLSEKESVKILTQFIRYGLVGITINVLGYLLFLTFTYLGVEAKLAMTMLYVPTMIAGYYGNRHWTFSRPAQLSISNSGLKYLLVHCIGYALNLFFLYIFADILGVTHYLVQAFAILFVALFIFFASRTIVFQSLSRSSGTAR
ncbi:MAG: GtrA family protein [Endozoicomonas sp.]